VYSVSSNLPGAALTNKVGSMHFFTADQHFNHANILRYANRPFDSVKEMNETIIKNHNKVVKRGDVVIHAGDFCFGNNKTAQEFIKRLKGHHIFLEGNHDGWMKSPKIQMWTKEFKKEGCFIVVSHYAMRTWENSHYNSWNLHGHSHGRLMPIGKQMDVGVDNTNFSPISLEDVIRIMKFRSDNLNLVTP
jgi:calcineurin-like phosphoesterase family protein